MDQGRYFAKRSPAITYKPYDACTVYTVFRKKHPLWPLTFSFVSP